jgi:hypothetical protein
MDHKDSTLSENIEISWMCLTTETGVYIMFQLIEQTMTGF